MRVFVTGASGFVGTPTVVELIRAGHQVLGLARSDASAAALEALGATVVRGNLEDIDSLQAGAKAADAVIHLGFVHDFANFAKSCEIDKRAIEALGDAIAGTQKPFLVTSGTGLVAPGKVATEEMRRTIPFPRASETAALALAAKGINAMVIRLSPSVHGDRDIGFMAMLISLARATGEAAFVGDGSSRWPAVHVRDAATLYRLALERGTKGATYHGVGDEAVQMKDIAGVIASRLNVPAVSKTPEEGAAHFARFGAFASFITLDQPASSALTQKELGWTPQAPSLLQDLAESKTYFEPGERRLFA